MINIYGLKVFQHSETFSGWNAAAAWQIPPIAKKIRNEKVGGLTLL
jgi:hypothetical protein